MRKIFAFYMLLPFGSLVFGQVTLSGEVLDSATREPMAQAIVQIGGHSLVTNRHGKFVSTTLPIGTHTVSVSHVGCTTKFWQIPLAKDTIAVFYLPHHVHSFEEVVAYGHEHNREPNAQFVHTVSTKKLEQQAATNLSEALKNTNGVRFLRTGNTIAKPIINGMHSNRISVINDDSKQEGQQWGSEHAPEIDPLSAGSIELIKGASTLRYGGDAMGGVIRVLPSTFADSSYSRISLIARGETNPKGGHFGLKLENHAKAISLGQRFVVNVKRNGDAQSANYNLSNTAFGQLSGSYYALLKTGKHTFSATASAFAQQLGILSAAHIGNLTDLNRALASDTPLILKPFSYEIQAPSQRIQHYAAKAKWDYASEQLGIISGSYTLQNNHRQEFDNHTGVAAAALDLNLMTQQVNLLVDKHTKQYRWQYGLSGESQQNIFKGRYFIPNYQRYKTGIFAIATLEKEDYLIEAGLRYDLQKTTTYRYNKNVLRIEHFDFDGISANISGWKVLNQDLRLHLSAATRFRSPDINELFSNGLHHGSAALEFGDLTLSQERAFSINSTLNYNHNRLRFQVEPYFHYFENYAYLKPSGQKQLTIRGAFPVFNYVQTNATYTGSDMGMQYRIANHWTAELTAALVYVRDITNDTYIFGIPAQQATAMVRYTFAELLGVQNGTWKIGTEYTAKQNRIELNEDFANSPSSYLLVNTELGGQYKNTPLYFNFGVQNLLNTAYRDYMNRYRYYADDLGINFYLTLNYTF